MNKKMCIVFMVLSIVSGIIGGGIYQKIFSSKVVPLGSVLQDGVLTVRELDITDKSGNRSIRLIDGSMWFYDTKDLTPRIILSKSEEGSSLMIFRKGGIMETGVSIGVGEFGGYFSTYNEDGTPDPR
jgi:hypothetical protein